MDFGPAPVPKNGSQRPEKLAVDSEMRSMKGADLGVLKAYSRPLPWLFQIGMDKIIRLQLVE